MAYLSLIKILRRLSAIILTTLGILLFIPFTLVSLLGYIFIGNKALEILWIPIFLWINPLYRKS